jgi:hypothetical protein
MYIITILTEWRKSTGQHERPSPNQIGANNIAHCEKDRRILGYSAPKKCRILKKYHEARYLSVSENCQQHKIIEPGQNQI